MLPSSHRKITHHQVKPRVTPNHGPAAKLRNSRIVLPIGFGDVKWAAVLALVCGWFGFRVAFTGLTAGAFIAVIVAGLLLLFRRASRHTVLPVGPSLSVGAFVALALHDV